jgi:hypothetical protein
VFKIILVAFAFIALIIYAIFLYTNEEISNYRATDMPFNECVPYVGKFLCDMLYNITTVP